MGVSCRQGEGQLLVMELCAMDLADALAAAQSRLDEALVKALMLQLLRGVHACHSAGAHQVGKMAHANG